MSVQNPTPNSASSALSIPTLIVITGLVTIVGLIALNVIRPALDNTSLDIQIVTMAGVVIAFLKTQQISQAQNETHSLINSRLTELVAAVRSSALAEGRQLGTKEATDSAVVLASQVAANQAQANLVLANTAKELAARAAEAMAAAGAQRIAERVDPNVTAPH